MSVQVKEVAFINLPVTDVARARRFYEGVLGLKATVEGQFEPGQWWIEYDVGTTALALSNLTPPSGGHGPSVALEVADLDAALAAVRSAAIPLTWGPVEFPPCRCLAIKDPDGNGILLHQRKQSPA